MAVSEEHAVPPDEAKVLFALWGLTRFDPVVVAEALRSRALSEAEANALADLIEGRHAKGFRLKIMGQGKGWIPLSEKTFAYERLLIVGELVDEAIAKGSSTEEAVNDAAELLGVSSPTVYRDLHLYRLRKGGDD
jgi:hypothetical protein